MIGFGVLLILFGLATTFASGSVTPGLVIGVLLAVGGFVLLKRSSVVTSDPVYQVLSRPETVTAFQPIRTTVTAGGVGVTEVDGIAISHRGGGDVRLPVPKGTSLDTVLAELRALCPAAQVR